jgi:pathogenesis-related protein 1
MRFIPTLTLLAGDVVIWGLLYACFVPAAEAEDPTARQTTKPVIASSAAHPTPATNPSRLTAAEVRELVAFHDAARLEVGVGPVEWSPDVAAFAQQWADHIAATGKFEHRPYASLPAAEGAPQPPASDSGTELPKQIYGENLAISNAPNYTPTDGARGWYAEKKDYEPGTSIPKDFSMFKAGHYTQLVWSKTKKIGAGKAVVQTGDFAGWTVIVCNYDPPGNWEGVAPFEIERKN